MSFEVSSELLVLQDFLRGPNTIQTHLLGWRVSGLSATLYDDFAADATAIMAGFADEAAYLETVLPSPSLTVQTFQGLFPDAFLSYNADITPEDLLPPYVRIMVAFKGEPRPWLIDPAWAWVPWHAPDLVESDPYDVDVIPLELPTSDALIELTEATHIFIVSAAADALIASLNELGAFVSLGIDTGSAGLDEAADLLALFGAVDDLAASLAEVSTLEVTLASGDGLDLDSNDASAVTAGFVQTDAMLLAGEDAVKRDIEVALTLADAPAIDPGEAVTIAVTVRTGDAPALGTAEAPTILGLLYTVNEQTPGITDALSAIDGTLVSADTTAVAFSETTLVALDTSDELVLGTADVSTSLNATLASGEEFGLNSGDAVILDGTLYTVNGQVVGIDEASTLETFDE